MRSSRILALSGVAFIVSVILAACGGGSKPPAPPAGPPSITSTVLSPGTVNVAYQATLQATGGTGTYTWSISSGSLPPGLTLNSTSALISGTPSSAGTFNFTAEVTDQASMTGTANLTITIGGALLITCGGCTTGNTLPTGNPGVPYNPSMTPQLSASGGPSGATYTWCAIETNGNCDSGIGGALPPGLSITTVNNQGVISGTPTSPAPVPVAFMVEVKDSETPPSTATANLSITIMGIGTTTLPNGTLFIPYTQSVTVVGGVSPYTWCVLNAAGTACDPSESQLPPGLSLAAGTCQGSRGTGCQITGAPTQSGTFNFAMQVQDSETPPATATQNLSITVAAVATNANLKGNYVFRFSGYNGSNSVPVIMAGAFVADGNGNITGGELDRNDGSGEAVVNCVQSVGSGPQQQTIMPAPSSVYNINPNGTGTLTLVTNAGTYNFQIAILSNGSGSLIQNNADPNTRGSGTIEVQTTGVTMSDIEGNFSLGIVGADGSGKRYSAAGYYDLANPNGDLSSSPLDVDDNGAASQQTFAGTLSTTLDSLGRGCFVNLTFNGQHSPFYVYAFYIVSAKELAIISTDPIGGTKNANLTLWSTLKQQVTARGFNNGTLAKAVVELSAQDPNGGNPVPDVTAGVFSGQSNSTNTCQSGQNDTGTFSYDENDGGTLSLQQSITGSYCVDANTGRVTLTGFNGKWASTPPVFYLGGTEPGFAVGTDTETTSGNVEAQANGPYTNGSVNGGYFGGTFSPAISGATDSVAALFANGAGMIDGVQYTSGPSGPGGPNELTLTYSVDSTGRALVQENGNTFGILYVVSASKVVMVPAGANPVMNVYQTVPGS